MFIWCHFSCVQRISFNVFYGAGHNERNSFSFYVWKALIFAFWKRLFCWFCFWNIFSLGKEFQSDSFCFIYFKMFLHCIIANIDCYKKFAAIFIFLIMYVLCHFSLQAFKIFSYSLILSNLTMMCLGVILIFLCFRFIELESVSL